ncbi:SH3 domain-containing protein [Sporosarcina sp. YIM B06819]|uniref:SH3 domain-containing protein n=1 Tax=Sporosarcina sp. YIM B06819 TaxID=3081769 RepID=UPI00298C852B|nr:SH3 domain-containing protein [Sporosarcina sp. YIM B06819]
MLLKRFLVVFSMILVLVLTQLGIVASATSVPTKGTVKSITLEVKEKPSPKAKKVGTLKKGTVIYVYSTKPGGWSEIRYNKKASFVATSGLNLPKAAAVAWNGNYSFDKSSGDSYYAGSIKVTKQTKTNFYFSLEVGSSYQDAHYFNGGVEGYANYNGDKAIVNFKDEYDQQCKMTIQKTKTGVTIKEDSTIEFGGCSAFRGSNIMFDGDYQKR